MSFAAALAAARSRPDDAITLAELASESLSSGDEELALGFLERASRSSRSARLWQWKGLLERSLDEHEQALASFEQAAGLDPNDLSIARGRARVALEAGVPAEQLYEQARKLAPSDGALLLGLAAARLAAGHGERAEAELASALVQAPLWTEGHLQLAQLRSMLGRPKDACKSVELALAKFSNQPALWTTLFELHLKARRFDSLETSLQQARQANAPNDVLRQYEFVAAVELGQAERADQLFALLDPATSSSLAVWQIRHLLRSGRTAQALPVIDSELAGPNSAHIWPYASAAWRLADDPRSDWLEGDPRFVSIIDLAAELPLDDVALTMRELHVAKGEYLDQSVRGGTQTDGPLFSRIDPVIRQLRNAIVRAVEKHRAQLPPVDERHPTLRHSRDRRVRFSGSWSVRLRSGGSHANHVHPQGWISSALYLGVPERAPQEPEDAGWLTLGEPDASMHLPLRPHRKIEPKLGRLVLFPSWMWHGTVPFHEGERLTVAFDVAPPR